MKSNYYQRQQARLERAQELADKNRAATDTAHKAAFGILEHIPPGQPILVGHHSEKRHRRDLARVDRHMEAARTATEKAAHYESKAATIERTLNGEGAISSDAPDAADLLRERIAKAEADQARMKAANKIICRKPSGPEHRPGKIADLQTLGFSERAAAELFTPDCFGGVGFQSFRLTNNGANIRRMKERLASLERSAALETTEREEKGVRVVENAEENRLQLFFPGKPSDETRDTLKRHGFRWCRTEGAWQRMLNNGARYAAKCVLEALPEA